MVFHVLNRGVGACSCLKRWETTRRSGGSLQDTLQVAPMRICVYCLMPNHWHFLLWPEDDGDLAGFMQRLTITHVRRWQENRPMSGLGMSTKGVISRFPWGSKGDRSGIDKIGHL